MFGSLVINFMECGDWKNADHGRRETGVDPGREKWLQKIPHKTALHPMISDSEKQPSLFHGEYPASEFL